MNKIAFRGGLLIDGTGAEPVKNSLVLVEDDNIVYAGAVSYTHLDVYKRQVQYMEELFYESYGNCKKN